MRWERSRETWPPPLPFPEHIAYTHVANQYNAGLQH